MARTRYIKPGFFRNADLVELPLEARLLFIGLWTLADRSGRLEDRPKQIKMEIFPADSYDCNVLIQQIADTGMLIRYEHGGKRYLQVTNFSKHQHTHKDERASTIPPPSGFTDSTVLAPCSPDASTVQARCSPDASTVQARCSPDAGTVLAGCESALNPEYLNPDTNTTFPPEAGFVGRSNAKTDAPALPKGFADFWQIWPDTDRKQARGKCCEIWKKARLEADAAVILAHVSALKVSAWLKDGGQYVPAPMVYLNQRRWDGACVAADTQCGGMLPGAI